METKNLKSAFLSSIQVKGLWGVKDITWDHLDPHVNILVGSNGSGKSTFLQMINHLLCFAFKELEKTAAPIIIKFNNDTELSYEPKKAISTDLKLANTGLEYINTFDIPTSKKSEQSQLYQELYKVIYEHTKNNFSFFDYRMKVLNYPEERHKIEGRIELLFGQIDSFFQSSGKKISINKETNKLIFTFTDSDGEIGPEELSSGEKQLLLILFKVFLQDGQPFILLMDEPELSLHIEWQTKLIGSIRMLNPNCQVILATHSPSIFADGWGDKLVFMEDIVKTTKNKK